MENVVFSSYFSVYILFPQDQKLLTKMTSDSPQSLRLLSCVPHRGPQPRIAVHTDTGTPWSSASSDVAKAGDSHATSGPTKIQCVPGPDYSGSVNLTSSPRQPQLWVRAGGYPAWNTAPLGSHCPTVVTQLVTHSNNKGGFFL